MTKKELKMLAGIIIKESDNYSKSAKIQLLNFILNEASEEQLKVLILDGKIENIENDVIPIINERFNIFEKSSKNLETVVMEDEEGWSSNDLPKGWTRHSAQKYWRSLTGGHKDKITQCMKELSGKVSDTGRFCGGLASYVGHRG